MAANWIHSWFLFLLNHLTWNHWNMICLVKRWENGVEDGKRVLEPCGCRLAEWMGLFLQFHSECDYTLNIPWECCGGTELFELRESLNKEFNSCIDFSTRVRKSQSSFLGLWTFSAPASCWSILLFRLAWSLRSFSYLLHQNNYFCFNAAVIDGRHGFTECSENITYRSIKKINVIPCQTSQSIINICTDWSEL